MLTLHHLNDSRSQRILWLLEELGTPYEMKRYQRNAETRLAPPELKEVHPLGKSPVITDGDVTIAESGAIVDYVIRHYGQGKDKPALMPAPGSADYEAYHEWLHYSEGSAMLPLMLNLYVSRLKEAGAPLQACQPSRLCRRRAEGAGVLCRGVADRRRHPDELCRRDGKSVREAGAIPEPRGLAGTDARSAGVPAFNRQGRAVQVCVAVAVIPGRCEASNPESRHSGFASRPGMTTDREQVSA